MALLCSAYGWTPAQVAQLTPAQTRYFLEHLPDVELRRAYPLAGLEATILNMMGGKRKKKSESDEPPLEKHELWLAIERLPFFAQPEWVKEATPSISVEAAQDFLKHKKRLAAWVLQVAPIDAIARAAE